MTFSFDPALPTDTDLVRFHIGDTNVDGGHYLENETIDYFVAAHSVEEAVLLCIKYIITQLSTPNFKQDWLSVDLDKARTGYENMLAEKEAEFGLASSSIVATATVSLPTRADSYQTTSDTYDGAP